MVKSTIGVLSDRAYQKRSCDISCAINALYIVIENDQEIPQSQTANNPVAP